MLLLFMQIFWKEKAVRVYAINLIDERLYFAYFSLLCVSFDVHISPSIEHSRQNEVHRCYGKYPSLISKLKILQTVTVAFRQLNGNSYNTDCTEIRCIHQTVMLE